MNRIIERRDTQSAKRGGAARKDRTTEVIEQYDATTLVGLRTCLHNSALLHTVEGEEPTIEVPKLRQLVATAAVSRCLMGLRLRGWELKALRKAMRMTLEEFANRLDEKTAIETISRWESEARPMGGYAEKLLRLVVCEELAKEAPGVSYNGSMIAHLRVYDPWLMNKEYEVPYIDLALALMKEPSGSVDKVYTDQKAAA